MSPLKSLVIFAAVIALAMASKDKKANNSTTLGSTVEWATTKRECSEGGLISPRFQFQLLPRASKERVSFGARNAIRLFASVRY